MVYGGGIVNNYVWRLTMDNGEQRAYTVGLGVSPDIWYQWLIDVVIDLWYKMWVHTISGDRSDSCRIMVMF